MAENGGNAGETQRGAIESIGGDELLRLEEAFRQVHRRIVMEWSKENIHGLTGSQASIVVKLVQLGPQRASVLAELLSVTSGAVTGMTDKLIELGLIVRQSDPDDRRVVLLDVTPDGRELVDRINAKRREIMNMMFSGLSHEEIGLLTGLYEHILRNMDARER